MLRCIRVRVKSFASTMCAQLHTWTDLQPWQDKVLDLQPRWHANYGNGNFKALSWISPRLVKALIISFVACRSPYLGRVTIWLQPCRVSGTTSVVSETKLLVILDIRGDDEFKRVWLKPWISVSWHGKLSSLQLIRMYPLFEITNHSEPHIVYELHFLHVHSVQARTTS